jgi:hypothetical protein
MDKDLNDLAGVSDQHTVAPEANPDTAREVFPVLFDNQMYDFRPTAEPIAPKVLTSSAQVSAETLQSVTGMEDVSNEDLANPALPNVAKE